MQCVPSWSRTVEPIRGGGGGGPEEVPLAAVAIAEGRVEVESIWRTDTPDGRRAEYWSRFRLRLTVTLALALLVGLPLVGVLYEVFVRE